MDLADCDKVSYRLCRALALFLLTAAFLPDLGCGRAPGTPGPGGSPAISRADRQIVTLADLVGPSDPLAAHDLHFDARFAVDALAYVKSGERRRLDRLAQSPAAQHLLNHARNFDYPDMPKDSTAALVASLVEPRAERAKRAGTCAHSLDFFTGPMLEDPHWVNDVLAYLPAGFRFHGSLFLTFGYDIGVAFPPNASLNGASSHFDGHPRELLYYAIHELHHAGFMTFHPPPRWADIKTCDDLLKAVEYLTQLEGMAVLAATERRRLEQALSADGDYIALQDDVRMQKDEALYLKEYEDLKKRTDQPADKDAWAVIERMSGGERLWYRVGARMAGRIEKELGRPALVSLVQEGPQRFFQVLRDLRDKPPSQTAPVPNK